MPLKRDPPIIDRRDLGSFPGGVGGSGELGHVRASEGAWIDINDLIEGNRVPPTVGGGVSKAGQVVTKKRGILEMVVPTRPPWQVRSAPGRGKELFDERRISVVAQQVRPPPVRRGPSDTSGGPPSQNIGVENMGLDLGSLLNTGIGAYRDIKVAGSQPQFVGYDIQGLNPFSNVPLNQYDMAAPMVDPGGILPPVGGGGGSCDDPSKGWVYKKVCGQYKWVKPKRRRRKVLLTESDFDSLLRIQSLKVNQNMTVALAKTLAR